MRREVVVVANAPNVQWIRIKVDRLKNSSSTPAASVPQFVGFSCLMFVMFAATR